MTEEDHTEEPEVREVSISTLANVLQNITGRASDLVRGQFHDEVQARGIYEFELIDAETGEVEHRQVHNTLMNQGRNEILAWIGGLALSNSTAPFENLAVGTDGSAINESDTTLGSESERIGLDPNTNSGNFQQDTAAVEITGTWLFGETQANVDIAEAGLFGAADGSTDQNTSEDVMLNRTVVDPVISKTSSQELKVTWTLSMG